MTCPLLRRSHPLLCRAVAGAPEPVPHAVAATYCRGAYGGCPAYRYVRASGRLLHRADFRAWVVIGISPGRTGAAPGAAAGDPDAA